jgi:hypothetical protein
MGLNASIQYRSGPQTSMAPQAMPRKKFTLPPYSPQYETAYQFDQEIQQKFSAFNPPALNTVSSNAAFNLPFPDSNAILTAFSQFEPTDGDLVKYSASFAIVPASWDDFKTMTFAFPGAPGALGQQNVRSITSKKVNMRLHYDYFLLSSSAPTVKDSGGNSISLISGSDGVSGNSSARYCAEQGNIPPIFKGDFYVCFPNQTPIGTTAGGVPYGPAAIVVSGNITNGLVPCGGRVVGEQTYLQTLPQLATYLQWVANAKPFLQPGNLIAWDSTHPPVWNGTSDSGPTAIEGQIVAEDSTLLPYAGNIIARVTPYVLVR